MYWITQLVLITLICCEVINSVDGLSTLFIITRTIIAQILKVQLMIVTLLLRSSERDFHYIKSYCPYQNISDQVCSVARS